MSKINQFLAVTSLGILAFSQVQANKLADDPFDVPPPSETPAPKSETKNSPTTPQTQTTTPGAQGTPAPIVQSQAINLTAGQQVIAVSRNSGRIEVVQIVRFVDDGTITVLFEGKEYPKWSRDQLAIMTGCLAELCVGQNVSWTGAPSENDLLIAGLLEGRRVVLQSQSTKEYQLAHRSELKKKVASPLSLEPQRNNRRLAVGQKVYLVEDDNQAYEARVTELNGSEVSIQLLATQEVFDLDSQDETLARTTGCTKNGLCVGQDAITTDRAGKLRSVTIVALQNENFAVVRVHNTTQVIGNWPAEALRKQ